MKPGDLVRHTATGAWSVYPDSSTIVPAEYTLVEDGPGWKRHENGSNNPVGEAAVRVLTPYGNSATAFGSSIHWGSVAFYKLVDHGQATEAVTVKLFRTPRGFCLPNGVEIACHNSLIGDLDWQAPPPPPWEPVVGERAIFEGDQITIRAIYKGNAIVESADGVGDVYACLLTSLSPPKVAA